MEDFVLGKCVGKYQRLGINVDKVGMSKQKHLARDWFDSHVACFHVWDSSLKAGRRNKR